MNNKRLRVRVPNQINNSVFEAFSRGTGTRRFAPRLCSLGFDVLYHGVEGAWRGGLLQLYGGQYAEQ